MIEPFDPALVQRARAARAVAARLYRAAAQARAARRSARDPDQRLGRDH